MKKKRISPYSILFLGFFGIIILGTLLLKLPFATKDDYTLSWIDSFFTSTSAVCVTGLLSVPSTSAVFTLFGKIVIILLIEIGGLSFVTIIMFVFSLLGLKIGIKDRILLKEALNQNSYKGIVTLTKKIVFITLIIQAIGAIINLFVFVNYYPFTKALGISIFHSISSFNNAGFDVFEESLWNLPIKNNLLFNLNTCTLIILGGIGFIVIIDILNKRKWSKLSLHSKIVLSTTLALIVFGTILLMVLNNGKINFLEALFQSVSARTAGLATIDLKNTLSYANILLLCILMFIGASPSSTGGGIKTTTLYTLIKSSFSFARGKNNKAFNRKIDDNSVFKAFILITISMTWVVIVIFLLSVFESKQLINKSVDFIDLLFETFSAFGTVGLTLGITTSLSFGSKLILCITMLFGRLGPITIISILNKHYNSDYSENVKYIEEKIIIG